jgi:hypothetical protein
VFFPTPYPFKLTIVLLCLECYMLFSILKCHVLWADCSHCRSNFAVMMAVHVPFPWQNPCTVWWNSILLVNCRLIIIDISLYTTSRSAIPLNSTGTPFGMSTSMPIPKTLGIGSPVKAKWMISKTVVHAFMQHNLVLLLLLLSLLVNVQL